MSEENKNEYEVPELTGVKMRVKWRSALGNIYNTDMLVYGKIEGDYIISRKSEAPLIRCKADVSPLPQPWEVPPEGYRLVTKEEREKYQKPGPEFYMYYSEIGGWLSHSLLTFKTKLWSPSDHYAVPLDFSFEPTEKDIVVKGKTYSESTVMKALKAYVNS